MDYEKKRDEKYEEQDIEEEMKYNRNRTLLLIASVLTIGIIIGATMSWAITFHKAYNASANFEDAPFGQGFLTGIGMGASMVMLHYECPDLNSILDFDEDCNFDKLIDKQKEIIENSALLAPMLTELDKFGGARAISNWLDKSAERTKAGIFGYSVPPTYCEEQP